MTLDQKCARTPHDRRFRPLGWKPHVSPCAIQHSTAHRRAGQNVVAPDWKRGRVPHDRWLTSPSLKPYAPPRATQRGTAHRQEGRGAEKPD